MFLEGIITVTQNVFILHVKNNSRSANHVLHINCLYEQEIVE